ncbi:MAG: peptidylprolyl isomerase [Thiobacillaceae bacterium]|jgi:peptidyl-prolyl cis-trans isomerase C
MKHPFKLYATMILLGLATVVQAADEAKPAADKPIAVVNGREIPAVYADLIKRDLLAQGQPDDARLDAKVRDSLISLELASRAAIDKGLDKDPRLAAVLDIRRKDQLAKAYLEDYVKSHPIKDAEIQSEYDKVKAGATGNEYKVRHILVKSETEAKSIISQLKKRAKFEVLAKKNSIDPGSAKNGGELGWNVPSAFVKEFADALSGMKKGETSITPVKSQFGWHVIRVEDVRPVQVPPLDEVKGDIVHQLQQARVREALQALRKDAKIE